MKKIYIKYVPRASSFCKTTITREQGKKIQKQEWFRTLEEIPKEDK